MADWLHRNEAWLSWVVWASGALFVVSVVLLPVLVALIPHDYFARAEPPHPRWEIEHRGLRIAFRVARNALGGLLLVLGVAMLVLPGQGLLAILAASVLLDFRGKRRAQLWFAGRPGVLGAMNWIRRRLGRRPIERVYGGCDGSGALG